jgi:hypothetical protein
VTGDKKNGLARLRTREEAVTRLPFLGFTDVAARRSLSAMWSTLLGGLVDQVAGRSMQTREQCAWNRRAEGQKLLSTQQGEPLMEVVEKVLYR